jgi:hypothetical protein
MRGVLHVLATLIVIPYAMLAGGFLILGHAIGAGSILAFFDRLVSQASWLMPWGVVAIGMGFLVLAALGLVARVRALGGLLLAMLALSAVIVIVTFNATTVTSDEVLFLLPCAGSLLFGAWEFAAERIRMRAVGNSA